MKKLSFCLLALLFVVPQLHAKSKSNSNSQTIHVSGQYQEWGNGFKNSMGFSSASVRSGSGVQVSSSKTFKNNGEKVSVGMQSYIMPKVSGNKVRYTVNTSVKRTDGSVKNTNYTVTQSGKVSGETSLGKSVTVKIGSTQGKSGKGRYSVKMVLVLKFTK